MQFHNRGIKLKYMLFKVVAVPECTDPSVKIGGVFYLYKDSFDEFDSHWDKVLADLRMKAQPVQPAAPTSQQAAQTFTPTVCNKLACLIAGLWAMRVFKGVVNYEGAFFP